MTESRFQYFLHGNGFWIRSCNMFQHYHNCPDDNQYTCDAPFKPPYVCNGCDERNHCHLEKHYYHAAKAQAEYEATLTTSRQGINMTPEELAELDAIISPLIKKGQPLSHIFFIENSPKICFRIIRFFYIQQQTISLLVLNFHQPFRILAV